MDGSPSRSKAANSNGLRSSSQGKLQGHKKLPPLEGKRENRHSITTAHPQLVLVRVRIDVPSTQLATNLNTTKSLSVRSFEFFSLFSC